MKLEECETVRMTRNEEISFKLNTHSQILIVPHFYPPPSPTLHTHNIFSTSPSLHSLHSLSLCETHSSSCSCILFSSSIQLQSSFLSLPSTSLSPLPFVLVVLIRMGLLKCITPINKHTHTFCPPNQNSNTLIPPFSLFLHSFISISLFGL